MNRPPPFPVEAARAPAGRGPLLRRAGLLLSLMIPLAACGSGTEAGHENSAPPAISDPTPLEAELLGQVLSGMMNGGEDFCIAATTPAGRRPPFWASALLPGNRRLLWPGDPEFDEASDAWDRSAPTRPNRIRLPRKAIPPGYRLVADPAAFQACARRLAFFTPLVEKDWAFVVADEQIDSSGPGGTMTFWTFRLRHGRWARGALGHTSYGRPVY